MDYNDEIVTINDKGEMTIYIEGLGTITEEGNLNFEEFLKYLLKTKYITG